MRIILQERDLRILRCCYEQQFLLLSHLQEYFFEGVISRRVRERVLELERAGLITREVLPCFSSKVIRLTRTGAEFIRQDHPLQIPQARRIDIKTATHDSLITSVRLRLQEFWDGTWLPERVLKTEEYPQVPDGVFLFQSGRKIAIEVENSRKDKRRFLKLMERWRDVDILLVLYVTTSDAMTNLVRKYLSEGQRQTIFGLVSWNELSQGAPMIWSPARPEGLNVLQRRTF